MSGQVIARTYAGHNNIKGVRNMRIWIGNLVSLVSAAFLFLGGIAKSKRGMYFFQFMECVFLIISQLVFLQVAGAVSMAFSAVRNHLASKDRYTPPALVTVFAANAIFGILLNTGGVIGLIPVAASLFLTAAAYFLREMRTVRIAVMINLAMWVAYAFLILDYVSAVTNLVAFAINLITLVSSFRKTGKGVSSRK